MQKHELNLEKKTSSNDKYTAKSKEQNICSKFSKIGKFTLSVVLSVAIMFGAVGCVSQPIDPSPSSSTSANPSGTPDETTSPNPSKTPSGQTNANKMPALKDIGKDTSYAGTLSEWTLDVATQIILSQIEKDAYKQKGIEVEIVGKYYKHNLLFVNGNTVEFFSTVKATIDGKEQVLLTRIINLMSKAEENFYKKNVEENPALALELLMHLLNTADLPSDIFYLNAESYPIERPIEIYDVTINYYKNGGTAFKMYRGLIYKDGKVFFAMDPKQNCELGLFEVGTTINSNNENVLNLTSIAEQPIIIHNLSNIFITQDKTE